MDSKTIDRYSIRTIAPVDFVHGTLYVVYDRWLGCDAGRPLPWRNVVEHEAQSANARTSVDCSYQARALVSGAWQEWHEIAAEVFENRKRWPRAGYETRVVFA